MKAVICSRSQGSRNWFVGGVADENGKEFTLRFDFLQKGAKYKARIYTDAPDAHYHNNPEAYRITEKTVRAGDRLKIKMAPGGGFAISLIAL